MEEILIIDDSPEITDIIYTIINEKFKNKFAITTFNDPEVAFEYYLEYGPLNRIILDLDMPKITGKELIQLIREFHEEQKISIITGSDNIEIENDLIKKFPEYNILRKPFCIKEIEEEIM
ncbi:MAG: hypothetical protein COA79_18425 [Planctomycetota bacterium]|nr:MAG: hypothetical protein COA79_18425 [Planctomycetota bacterium]